MQLGFLPWLDPKAPYETLSRLVDRYGRIYTLKLGSVRVVVLSDPLLIRKVLSMEETTGRAPLYLTHGIMQGYGKIFLFDSLIFGLFAVDNYRYAILIRKTKYTIVYLSIP